MHTTATLAHLRSKLNHVRHTRKSLEQTAASDDPALSLALCAEERLAYAIAYLEWRRDREAHAQLVLGGLLGE